MAKSNFLETIAEGMAEKIFSISKRFAPETPFGMKQVSAKEGAKELSKIATLGGRKAFREKVGLPAMLEMARHLEEKRGRFDS